MAPKKLYKCRPFNANTLRLLSKAETYYADPSKFNDPLDCKPVISVDTDISTLEKVCYQVVGLSVAKEAALKVIDRHRYESSQYGDYKTDKEAAAYYRRFLTGTVEDWMMRWHFAGAGLHFRESIGTRNALRIGPNLPEGIHWAKSRMQTLRTKDAKSGFGG